jgi:dTDP-glucose 4,6-dehydratase
VRFCVAGGAGFIGSHLTDRLLSDGHEVVVLDNFVTGRPRNLAHLDAHPRLTVLQADICRPPEIPGPFDGVFNLASPASPNDFVPLSVEILLTGSTGTRALLDLARAKGARFLQASTSEVYGDPLVHPQREDYLGNVDPIGVRGVYDEAKRFGESLVMAYHRRHAMPTRIARIFNTYGPRMRPDDGRVIPNLINQALDGKPLTLYGGGRQTRSFCYVDDLVSGFLKLMESDEPLPVNLGNPVEITVAQLAEEIIELTGSPSRLEDRPLPPGDPKRRCPDITRARTRLGWQPIVERRDGLRRTIEFFRAVRDSAASA